MEQWVTATELLGVKSIRGQIHKAVKDSREMAGWSLLVILLHSGYGELLVRGSPCPSLAS